MTFRSTPNEKNQFIASVKKEYFIKSLGSFKRNKISNLFMATKGF